MAMLTPAASNAAEVSALSLPSFMMISSVRWSAGDVANEDQRVEEMNVPGSRRIMTREVAGFGREAAACTPQSEQHRDTAVAAQRVRAALRERGVSVMV